MKKSTSSYHIENKEVFHCLTPRQSDERRRKINKLSAVIGNFFTGFPQEMWKLRRLSAFFLVLLCFVGLVACSLSRGTAKPAQKASTKVSSADKDLISSGPEVVTKRLGEPTAIAKTSEGHILWVYEPSWKLIPNDKGTVYVEFENNKVVKVFKIK